jgi:hypothetical protein
MNVQVTVEGISPLLMNRFYENEVMLPPGGGTAVRKPQQLTPREQAALKAYRGDDGQLYIPGTNFYAAIMEAGRSIKVGKRQITTAKTSILPAGVFLLDIVCPLGTDHFEVDQRSVVNPSTSGRVMCYRPRLDQWSTKFTLEIDTAEFHPNTVRELVDRAGKAIGIGDFRPQRKGPFGRFVVTSWVELTAAKVA